MKHKSNVNGFNQWVEHNIHENISKVQEGGTSLIMFGPLTSSVDFGAEKEEHQYLVGCLL
jgi:hypothetical protein